jgi:NAD(P)-dependent dehydrogenase (short-subunit alcohol dehydrogenase family)
MFGLKDRTVVVTGAAGYLGQAICRGVLDSDGTVIMVGRSETSLNVARNAMPAQQTHRCHLMPADITDETAIADLVTQIGSRFGEVHGLVNNAYAGRVGAIASLTADDFTLASKLNLIAPFLLARGLEPCLTRGARESGSSASIVNVASMYAKVSPDPSVYEDTGNNNPAHYGASKAGLIQLTRYLACHLNPTRIRVNSVSPGPFPATAGTNPDDPFLQKLRAKVPMRRLGDSNEIAGPVIFLLSVASAYVNGTDLAVDGGWTAW